MSVERVRPPSSNKLEHIDENAPADWLPSSVVRLPETPTESMEFLARSWSLSATELSKALSNTNPAACKILDHGVSTTSLGPRADDLLNLTMQMKDPQLKPPSSGDSSPNSPPWCDDHEAKELFLLHQALHPDLLFNQLIPMNGPQVNKAVLKGKTTGRWSSKEQKEIKKHEMRTHKAQLHASVSVAGVAAAIAAITASNATEITSTNMPVKARVSQQSPKMPTAIASAAALIASHCIEIAEEMGADRHQILTAVHSAVNARSNGDIMALTAGAATALRGAATLKARLRNGYCGGTVVDEDGKDSIKTAALNFISVGGELLKRTRKGDLHWKQVSFKVDSTFQVVMKMKSKHVAGTITKKKKFVVSGVCSAIPAWPGREIEECDMQITYFGVQIDGRVIEFECKNIAEKQMWIDGIRHMLNCRLSNIA